MSNIKKFFTILNFLFKKKKLENEILFKIATLPEELDEIFQLRYDVYCLEYNYLDKEKYTDKKEKDIYDSIATHLIALNKQGKIIGYLRLIKDTPNLFNGPQIPLEKYFNFEPYRSNNKTFAELSRFIILRNYRENLLIMFGLIKIAILFSVKNNITGFCISVSNLYVDKYKRFGFRQVGQPYMYSEIKHTNLSVTLILEIIESGKNLSKINPLFNGYLREKSKNMIIQ